MIIKKSLSLNMTSLQVREVFDNRSDLRIVQQVGAHFCEILSVGQSSAFWHEILMRGTIDEGDLRSWEDSRNR